MAFHLGWQIKLSHQILSRKSLHFLFIDGISLFHVVSFISFVFHFILLTIVLILCRFFFINFISSAEILANSLFDPFLSVSLSIHITNFVFSLFFFPGIPEHLPQFFYQFHSGFRDFEEKLKFFQIVIHRSLLLITHFQNLHDLGVN